MYNGFNTTIHNILGPKRPMKRRLSGDRTSRQMSQENYEKARKLASEREFSTNPTAKRRLIVTPYTRVKGKPEAVSAEGKTMAIRLQVHPEAGRPDDTDTTTKMKEWADVKLDKSYLFKDVKKSAVGEKKKFGFSDIMKSL